MTHTYSIFKLWQAGKYCAVVLDFSVNTGDCAFSGERPVGVSVKNGWLSLGWSTLCHAYKYPRRFSRRHVTYLILLIKYSYFSKDDALRNYWRDFFGSRKRNKWKCEITNVFFDGRLVRFGLLEVRRLYLKNCISRCECNYEHRWVVVCTHAWHLTRSFCRLCMDYFAPQTSKWLSSDPSAIVQLHCLLVCSLPGMFQSPIASWCQFGWNVEFSRISK